MSDALASLVTTALTFVLTLAAMRWLFRQTDRAPEVAEGRVVLRYPSVFGWIGAVFLAAMAGLTVWGLLDPQDGSALLVVAFLAMVGLPGLVLVLSAWRTHVVVDSGGLTLHSWARRHPADVRWREVERVSFSRLMGYLVFHTHDGRRVRLSAFLVGIYGLAETLAESLEGAGAREAYCALREYRAAYGG